MNPGKNWLIKLIKRINGINTPFGGVTLGASRQEEKSAPGNELSKLRMAHLYAKNIDALERVSTRVNLLLISYPHDPDVQDLASDLKQSKSKSMLLSVLRHGWFIVAMGTILAWVSDFLLD